MIAESAILAIAILLGSLVSPALGWLDRSGYVDSPRQLSLEKRLGADLRHALNDDQWAQVARIIASSNAVEDAVNDVSAGAIGVMARLNSAFGKFDTPQLNCRGARVSDIIFLTFYYSDAVTNKKSETISVFMTYAKEYNLVVFRKGPIEELGCALLLEKTGERQ